MQKSCSTKVVMDKTSTSYNNSPSAVSHLKKSLSRATLPLYKAILMPFWSSHWRTGFDHVGWSNPIGALVQSHRPASTVQSYWRNLTLSMSHRMYCRGYQYRPGRVNYVRYESSFHSIHPQCTNNPCLCLKNKQTQRHQSTERWACEKSSKN